MASRRGVPYPSRTTVPYYIAKRRLISRIIAFTRCPSLSFFLTFLNQPCPHFVALFSFWLSHVARARSKPLSFPPLPLTPPPPPFYPCPATCPRQILRVPVLFGPTDDLGMSVGETPPSGYSQVLGLALGFARFCVLVLR